MNFLIHVHGLTVAIAVSYLTLLVADTATASGGAVLAIYAVLMVVMTTICLTTEMKHRGH